MIELAADACGPRKHGGHCGIAFVYRSETKWWHADFEPLKKQYDATALELQATAMGLTFLAHQFHVSPEIRVYSDASRLFEYLAGEKVIDRHQPFMNDIRAKLEVIELQGFTIQFEQVMKHQRERYPLYLMADALSRHARTLPLDD